MSEIYNYSENEFPTLRRTIIVILLPTFLFYWIWGSYFNQVLGNQYLGGGSFFTMMFLPYVTSTDFMGIPADLLIAVINILCIFTLWYFFGRNKGTAFQLDDVNLKKIKHLGLFTQVSKYKIKEIGHILIKEDNEAKLVSRSQNPTGAALVTNGYLVLLLMKNMDEIPIFYAKTAEIAKEFTSALSKNMDIPVK